MEPTPPHLNIHYRCPTLEDGLNIHQLIAESPPLDLNSSYLYFLQSSHFANSCVLAEQNGQLLGFVSSYLRPDKPSELFIWQLVVAQRGRGKGIAKGLIKQLIRQTLDVSLHSISCTIGPSNLASQGVFQSLARDFGLQLDVQPFLTPAHFATCRQSQHSAHEAEDYYRLTAANQRSLSDVLSEPLAAESTTGR